MGSYSNLYVDGYPILTEKNGYSVDLARRIFCEADYIEENRLLKEKNKITWGDVYDDEDGIELFKGFRSTGRICRERLELFGIEYSKAKEDYEATIGELKEAYDFLQNSGLSYEHYLETIKSIINSRHKEYSHDSEESFSSYLNENELIFEEQNALLALWSVLYVLDDDCTIEYDLTDIIDSGWLENRSELVNEKIIVFTEGKTDVEFIKIGIKRFFPYLYDYYHFMDFENSKYEANASRLVHTVKSFVGSGIKNLIIAIFDNDSAAEKEIRNLKAVKLPPNIKVLKYPPIEWANDYPTIGPSGIQNMNINGLAGSIEMYLGLDCLQENGTLIPIQWTGYMETINQYQGSILKKEEVQRRFREKASNIDVSTNSIENWRELISIIELMNGIWKSTD